MAGFLCHKDGDKSSKKLVGFALIGLSICMGLIVFFRALNHPLGDSKTLLYLFKESMMWGCIMLGINVLPETVEPIKNLIFKKGKK